MSNTISVNTDLDLQDGYLTGWRLNVITAALCIAILIASMDTSITSTAVLTITNELGGFDKSSWIMISYWLTAGAFQMIWAKISDTYGRKPSILATLFIFTAFSGACGGSQTIMQLIMFRWLQGLGGCGIQALGQLVFVELVPPAKYPKYISILSIAMTCPLVLGPFIGGAISSSGNWRWIFLLNIPICVVVMLIVCAIFPSRLTKEPRSQHGKLSIKFLRRIDFLGCTLLLGTCLLLTTGLEQGARGYSFDSPFVLPLIICSGPFLVAFLVSQWYITNKKDSPDPVLPWRFFEKRDRAAVILLALFNGGVLAVSVVQIPQRFVTVNGETAFAAAAKLLPFGAFVVFGTLLAVPSIERLHIPPPIVLGFGGLLEVIGTTVLSQTSAHAHITASQYGSQVLIGTGVGLTVSSIMMLIKTAFEERDYAVATAAQSQFRNLGGLIAVSIGTAVTNRSLKPKLQSILSPQYVSLILQRTEALSLLSGEDLARARISFGIAYNEYMYVAIGFATSCVLIALTAIRKPQAKAVPHASNDDTEEVNMTHLPVSGESKSRTEEKHAEHKTQTPV